MSKTKISAEIVADSMNPWGDRITSMVLTFPRIVLAELNTHRMFSRNSASSRAIPAETMRRKVIDDPFIPIAWQKEHKGMQGTEYITDPEQIAYASGQWIGASHYALEQADELKTECGVTKQITNRLLEPFLWHKVLVTATHYENFFDLRCPQYEYGDKVFRSREDVFNYAIRVRKANRDVIDALDERSEIDWLNTNKSGAEIHISRLAECMWDAMNASVPKQLKYNEWHIPFGDKIEDKQLFELFLTESDLSLEDEEQALNELRLKIAVARCARTSYDNFEGSEDYQKDINLYNNLLKSKHASPFEHCAQSMNEYDYGLHVKSSSLHWIDWLAEGSNVLPSDNELGWSRNFKGFLQYRETIGL